MPKANLNRILAKAAEKLETAGIDAGMAEAEIVLCDLLDLDRLKLYLDAAGLITDDIRNTFNAVIERRCTRYPLQYILGSAWFYNRKFLVNESVMIPCPETELLLESVLRAGRSLQANPVRLLEIGCGSGVVAVSAALEDPQLDITAIDISEAALAVARQNAERLGVAAPLRLMISDLFSALSGERFDIIASNPPYIADGDYAELPPEVKADPKISLVAGLRGLDIIKRLVTEAPDHLNRPGILMFEIGYDQAEAIFEMVDVDGRYADCILLKDLADIDRIIICKAT